MAVCPMPSTVFARRQIKRHSSHAIGVLELLIRPVRVTDLRCAIKSVIIGRDCVIIGIAGDCAYPVCAVISQTRDRR